MYSALIKVRALDSDRKGHPVSVKLWDADDGSEPLWREGLLSADRLQDDSGLDLGPSIRKRFRTSEGRRANAEIIGDDLGQLLLSAVAETKSLLVCPTCEHAGSQPHSRVYLDIEESLSRLPWELARIGDKFVFGQKGHVCLRVGPTSMRDAYFPERMRPLKVLIVVGQTNIQDQIRAECEIDAVYRAVNRRAALWRVKVMRIPTWSDLKQEVDDFPPDIVHLIGHSAPRGDEWAMVVRSDGKPYPLGADQLNRLFAPPASAHGPRLFVLNTCDSMDIAAGLDLRDWRECTVVAMQSLIEGGAAANFSEAFYKQLVGGKDVDAAAQLARHELSRRAAVDDHAWAVPVVIVSSRSHVLLPGYSAVLAESQALLRGSGGRWRGPLLDRVDECRTLLDDDPLTGVTGDAKSGKSHLVFSYLMSCHQTGQLAVYVDLAADSERRTPRDALARIADEAVRQLMSELPDTDFGELKQHGREGRLRAEVAALTVHEHFEAVLHGLDLIADREDRAMVVALDGFERVADENQDDFAEQIRMVVKGAARSPNRVRVIVVSGPPAGAGGADVPLARSWRYADVPIIRVGGYPRRDLWVLYREACARYGQKWDRDFGGYLRTLVDKPGGPLLPEQFMAAINHTFQDPAGG